MYQRMSRAMAVEGTVLMVGLLVQVIGSTVWTTIAVGASLAFVASVLISVWSHRQAQPMPAGSRRQQLEGNRNTAIVFAAITLFVAVMPREFWVDLGGALAVTAGVLMIITYLVRNMFPAPKKS